MDEKIIVTNRKALLSKYGSKGVCDDSQGARSINSSHTRSEELTAGLCTLTM